MNNGLSRTRLLETSAIIIGYAMSRLDDRYLQDLGCATWREAFHQASEALGVRPASFKNLRDEFDPVHANARRGWHARPLRPNRQRVMGEMCELSDEAVVELVKRVLARDPAAIEEVVSALAAPTTRVHNVADRLLTGRLAEEYFLRHCERITGWASGEIQDMRLKARGFDFAIRSRPSIAVEVKGLRRKRGEILFTDREWKTAAERRGDYLVVIVGNLDGKPSAKMLADPHANLDIRCRYSSTIAAMWTAAVHVN